MNFIDRLQRSWELLKRSIAVMRSHPRLLLFPLVTALFTILIAGFFLGVPVLTFVLQDTGHLFLQGEHWQVLGQRLNDIANNPDHAATMTATFAAVGIVIYIVSMIVATFCNVAFYNEIIKALAGQPVSLAAGYRFALTRIKSILAWSLFAASVGLLIQMLSERLGFIGKMLMRLVGTVWSVACVFVIPIIIRKGSTNPLQTLRESTTLLKRTWGESLVGYVGFSVAGLCVFAACCIGLFGCMIVCAIVGFPVVTGILSGVSVCLVLAIILGLFLHVADNVFKCALYVYASEGVVPEPFSADLLDAAWKVKGK